MYVQEEKEKETIKEISGMYSTKHCVDQKTLFSFLAAASLPVCIRLALQSVCFSSHIKSK
jgi:hypothetical protein